LGYKIQEKSKISWIFLIFAFMKKVLQNVIDFILLGNFFIAACAALQTLQTCKLRYFSVAGSPILVFVFWGTFLLYNIHKPINYWLKKEFIANPRFQNAKRFEAPLSILVFIAALICFNCFFLFKQTGQQAIMICGALSLAYVLPILKGKRLRDIPFLKIILISLVWASVCVVLPISIVGRGWGMPESLMFLEKALFIFALTIPFDIRDMTWDAQTGIKTIPLSIGLEKAKRWSSYAIIGSFLFVIILSYFGVYSLKQYIALSISLILSEYLIQKTQGENSNLFFYGLIDGQLALQGLLILFV
jgi:4-hydroxybenzoate polyprenyltransferase